MLYSPERRTLDIVFRGTGGSYRYLEVSPEEWQAFRRASSKGTYLNQVFKALHPRYVHSGGGSAGFVALLAANMQRTPRDLPDANVWGFYEM